MRLSDDSLRTMANARARDPEFDITRSWALPAVPALEGESLETYRRRIYKAALLRHQRKTGSNCLVIKLNKDGINTVELTEILLDGLLRKFERLAISEYGSVEAVKAIRGIYSNAVDVNGSGEFLTDSGKELIDELISELVEFVKKQKPVNAEAGND